MNHRRLFGGSVVGLAIAVVAALTNDVSLLPAVMLVAGALSGAVLLFHGVTERQAARLPRRGAPETLSRGIGLAVAVPVAALLTWWEYGWWFGMSAGERVTDDVEVYDNDVLAFAWGMLLVAYAVAASAVLARQARRGGPVTDGPVPPWRPVAQLIDLAVVGLPLAPLLYIADLGTGEIAAGVPRTAAGAVLALVVTVTGVAWLATSREIGSTVSHPRRAGRGGLPGDLVFGLFGALAVTSTAVVVSFAESPGLVTLIIVVAAAPAAGYAAAVRVLTRRVPAPVAVGVAARLLGAAAAIVAIGTDSGGGYGAPLVAPLYGGLIILAVLGLAALAATQKGKEPATRAAAPWQVVDLLLAGLIQTLGLLQTQAPLEVGKTALITLTLTVTLTGAALLTWNARRIPGTPTN